MENCIFCKIAAGEIPSNTIYEDDSFRVILDLGPATKGHALVLPKNHYADLFEIPEDVLADAAKVAKKVAGTMKEKLSCDGLNLVQNNGEAAGQTVMHFHLHIIPRYANDGQHILWKPTSPSPEELAAIKDTIVGA
ncbi:MULTISPECIES: HIT family protein [unclassified Butyrivibrio]|uniref:HIT family protein n=1 Tax=unclassified Butyrivibrio TaxID=2639466 RepID=UPI0003B5CAF4|nr:MULTISPECIES: HIT family protein [unclassified Butyrivibrio]